MRANKCLLNGRTLDNRINMNAWIWNSLICLLYRTKLIPMHMLTSRNTVSPFQTMVVDFDNLTRGYLIFLKWYRFVFVLSNFTHDENIVHKDTHWHLIRVRSCYFETPICIVDRIVEASQISCIHLTFLKCLDCKP